MAGGDLIRAATFQGFQSLVFELGSDPEAILNEAGLTGEELADPEAQVSVVSFHDALNIAADVTQTPRFGLLLAQRQSFEMLGAVGYATKHAPDLRTAIEELSTYMGTHDISARSFLEVDANTAFWCYANNSFESGSIVQHVELALSLGVNFMRSALGQSWKANAVHYQHSKPKDCTLYARLLRCPVYFDNDFNGI
ncbi:MAG: AraC family transcriptional regulator [Pseudomonadota bacterium]